MMELKLIEKKVPVEFKNVKEMSPEELKEEFFRNLEITTINIRRNAEIFAELSSRGVDFSEARFSYGGVLMDVAGGKLHYEVATRFLYSRTTLKKLSEYPLEQQVLYGIKNESISLVISIDPLKTVTKSLMEMSQSERNIALGPYGIRKVAEQEKILRTKREKGEKKWTGKILKFDETGTLKRGNAFVGAPRITVKEVISALNTYLRFSEEDGLEKILIRNSEVEFWK